jgi:hypothetical protein
MMSMGGCPESPGHGSAPDKGHHPLDFHGRLTIDPATIIILALAHTATDQSLPALVMMVVPVMDASQLLCLGRPLLGALGPATVTQHNCVGPITHRQWRPSVGRLVLATGAYSS